MPIYEYRCSVCGVRFEQWQHFGDPAPLACPNGHDQVRRLLSEPAIIFKGSGFYATDHGRNGSRATGRKPADKADAEAGAASKDDSKSSDGVAAEPKAAPA